VESSIQEGRLLRKTPKTQKRARRKIGSSHCAKEKVFGLSDTVREVRIIEVPGSSTRKEKWFTRGKGGIEEKKESS